MSQGIYHKKKTSRTSDGDRIVEINDTEDSIEGVRDENECETSAEKSNRHYPGYYALTLNGPIKV